MIRTTLDKSHIKRPIRPLYAMTQATPKACYLDPAWDRSVLIWPGMVMTSAGGDLVTLPNAVGDMPQGLSALYVGGEGIDEPREAGINAFAIWVLNQDAEFQIDAPSFDTNVAWAAPTDGTEVKVHFWATGVGRGKLVPAGAALAAHTISTAPVARLIKVDSALTITIAGLAVRS